MKKYIYKICNNKLLIRILTFLPPLFGIIVFTYVVKYSNNPNVDFRMSLFQGVTAYFSLILLGFTYVKERSNILGLRVLFLLIAIVLFPVVFYVYNNFDFLLVFLFVLNQFFSSLILYILIVNDKIIRYLLFASLNSIFVPLSLVFTYSLLFIILLIFVLIFCFIFFRLVKKLEVFKWNTGGVSFAKSIFFQSPLIILPLFDYKIAEIIGSANYSEYVFYYKYINGVIVLLFSFKQLNLVFSKELLNKELILKSSFLLLILLIVCNFFNNNYSMFLSIIFYSIGVNFCSLLIRNELLNGVSFSFAIVGVISTIIYSFLINVFPEIVSLSNSMFINLMFITILIPSIAVFFYRKYINLKSI